MEEAIRRREAGLLAPPGPARVQTHRPHAFQQGAGAAVVPRLALGAELGADGAQFAVSWDEDAGRLLAAGKDCRLRVWRGDGSEPLCTVDTVRVEGPGCKGHGGAAQAGAAKRSCQFWRRQKEH